MTRTWFDAIASLSKFGAGAGFERAYAICRVTLGVIFLLCTGLLIRAPLASDEYLYPEHPQARGFFWTDYRDFYQMKEGLAYQPMGLLVLFGETPPAPALCDFAYRALCVASVLVLCGLFTRISLAVCVVSATLLFGLHYSYLGEWCHPPIGILLPAIAMLCGPRSTCWSLDAWIDRKRGVDPLVLESARGRACLPVLLAQFSIALIFANAALYKAYLTSRAPFAWALSDNLRNLIIMQHVKFDEELPGWLQFVVTRSWAYKGMAFMNLIAQFGVLAACFFPRRPCWRLFFGGFFVAEMVGLALVMKICNPLWYLLVVFFVDWDFFLDQARGAAPRQPASSPACLHGLPQVGLAACFVAFLLYVSLCHYPHRLWTFPFTSFPMYSGIHAPRPYDQHLPCEIHTSKWRIETDPPLSRAQAARVKVQHSYLPWSGQPLEPALRRVRRDLEAGGIREVRLLEVEKTLLVIPAYSRSGRQWAPQISGTQPTPRLAASPAKAEDDASR
jgi:hypothetical protein